MIKNQNEERNMKRIFGILLIICLMLSGLTSCGGGINKKQGSNLRFLAFLF